jgi:hypothetical protein
LIVQRILNVNDELSTIGVGDCHLGLFPNEVLVNLKALCLLDGVMVARGDGGIVDFD